jgi:hypothetical protein
MRPIRSRLSRSVALTVALAVVVGSGINQQASAGKSAGERAVFVPITPCRLFDTRPGSDNVGPRGTPLVAGETFPVQTSGQQGNCSLPTDAVGISMNVAVIDGTAGSYLTVFPSDAMRPLAANLNWVGGQPPTPNKVDADLAADGRVSFYNFAGTVHIAADVVGYYVDHDHDDRYYTEAESDNRFVNSSDAAVRDPLQVVIGPMSFAPERHDMAFERTEYFLENNDVSGDCFFAPAELPHGATLTRIRARIVDDDPATDASLTLRGFALSSTATIDLGGLQTDAAHPSIRTFVHTTSLQHTVIDRTAYRYFVRYCSPNLLYDVVLNYTMPPL